ncbi:MAG: DUF5985 family protein, partial [Steroidobacteraceae bacterium]
MNAPQIPEKVLQFLAEKIDTVPQLESLLLLWQVGAAAVRPGLRERPVMMDGFLLGVVVTGSAIAGAFFLKFWRQTRDPLFLAFAVSFLIEACNRTGFLFLDDPHQGDTL